MGGKLDGRRRFAQPLHGEFEGSFHFRVSSLLLINGPFNQINRLDSFNSSSSMAYRETFRVVWDLAVSAWPFPIPGHLPAFDRVATYRTSRRQCALAGHDARQFSYPLPSCKTTRDWYGPIARAAVIARLYARPRWRRDSRPGDSRPCPRLIARRNAPD